MIRPSFKPRAPYILHFEDQTVVLGDPEFLEKIDLFLGTANIPTRPTYWDQAYAEQDGLFGPDPGPEDLNSVGMDGDEEAFWRAMEAASFQRAEWPEEESATVYMPSFPDWLASARTWYYDPVCPPLGPGAVGGWTRRRGGTGHGFPVGLFQLTEADSFWLFASDEDVDGILELCRDLARFRQGFDHVTPYLGPDDTIGSVAFPLVCREPLTEELMVRGVDVETLFWK